MNFEFNDEQHLVRDQASNFLTKHCGLNVARGVLETEEYYAADVWKQVVDLGWTATVIPEEYGGLGLSYLELVLIAEQLGRVCAPLPFASSVYLATEALLNCGSEKQKATWLPKLATGEVIGTLAYSEGLGETTSASLNTTVVDGRISGRKNVVANANVAELIIVVAGSEKGDGASLYIVPGEQEGVTREAINSIDPSLNHGHIVFHGAAAEPLGEDGKGWALLESVLNRAAVLYAWEQLGGSDACLEMARDYAMQRFAFGRAIGSFQAIKHKLAEMYVKNTLARSNAYFGAWALNENAAELPLAAATARIASTQAYYYASKENIQTHGGMGYTWELDCQFFYRRSKVLAVAIGSERQWQDKLIAASDIELSA